MLTRTTDDGRRTTVDGTKDARRTATNMHKQPQPLASSQGLEGKEEQTQSGSVARRGRWRVGRGACRRDRERVASKVFDLHPPLPQDGYVEIQRCEKTFEKEEDWGTKFKRPTNACAEVDFLFIYSTCSTAGATVTVMLMRMRPTTELLNLLIQQLALR